MYSIVPHSSNKNKHSSKLAVSPAKEIFPVGTELKYSYAGPQLGGTLGVKNHSDLYH